MVKKCKNYPNEFLRNHIRVLAKIIGMVLEFYIFRKRLPAHHTPHFIYVRKCVVIFIKLFTTPKFLCIYNLILIVLIATPIRPIVPTAKLIQ